MRAVPRRAVARNCQLPLTPPTSPLSRQLRGFVAVDASELVRSFQRDAESAGPAEAAPPRRAFSSHAAAASLLGGLQTFDKPGWWGSSQEALQSMAAAVDEEY